ncbi:MAG: PAS domain-containing protein [Calditrichaeota bacterium]|nr:PAS domain-containing protein [Calditrichota bacterium]MCB9369026.1 PAS domain-containing protein [Calditrichota bacterium]
MARTKPLFSRLYIPYVAVAIATLVLLLFFIGTAFRRAELRQLENSIENRVDLIRLLVASELPTASTEQLQNLLQAHARAGSLRLTLMDSLGNVTAESDTLPSAIPNQKNRAEVAAALQGKTGKSVRLSHEFRRNFSFVAIPVYQSGLLVAVLRGGERVEASRWDLFWSIGRLIVISVLLIMFGTVLIFLVVRRIATPIETIKQGADRFAAGKLDELIEEPDTTELCSLSRALNNMAVELDDRIRTVERQREEQNAILAAMIEGVLAVDREGRVIMLNAAAARLFEVDSERVKGRLIEEAVRSTDIQQFVNFTQRASQPVEREIVRFDNKERILQLRGTPILDLGEVVGVLVVINDVTQIRKLEVTRRDFVANASHELKTPVTAIMASIETLREGAIDNPQDAERFLDIIARQADYLQSIIEDLLSLARIEQASESNKLAAEDTPILLILQDAIEATATAADIRGQKIEIDCPPNLRAAVNAFLIRQAVINLIDNACKYSPENTAIKVSAKQEANCLMIEVEDQGPGIAEKHLSRIFERFYRIEASRNRKYGGTGLGLAIVKHAALAHGGNADVKTELGKGSTFFIRVPLNR